MIIVRLNSEIVKILQIPDFRNRLIQEGAGDPIGNSPEETAKFIRADMENLDSLMMAAGIDPQ